MNTNANPQEQAQVQEGEQPPQPVVVDVEGGSAEEQRQPEEGQQQQPGERQPQRRRPTNARIQTLTHERDEARDYAARMQQELADARKAAQEAQSAREAAERAGMENYGARVKADVAAAEKDLLAAEEAADSAAKVAAQKKLAKAAAQEADFEAWQQTQPKPQERQQQEQRQEQQQQPQQRQQEVVPDAATLDFLDQNRWFDAFERTEDGRIATDRTGRPIANPDYDENMHDAALIIHKRIERQIRLGQKSRDYLASPEYFQEISDGIAQNFPDAFEDGQQQEEQPPTRRTPAMSQSRQPVAPANRQPPQQQNGNGRQNGSKVTLDGEQAAFVRSLVDNGTMRYPVKHPDPQKRGQKMDYKDAYVEYAKRMTSDQADKANGNRQ